MDLCVIDSAPTNCLCVPQERVSLMNLWRCQAYLRSSAMTWLTVSSGEPRKRFCYNCCSIEPHTMSRHTACSQQWHASSQSAILHDSIWPIHFPDMLANFSGTFIPGKSVGLPFMHFFIQCTIPEVSTTKLPPPKWALERWKEFDAPRLVTFTFHPRSKPS